jgi:hypothetical protein
MTDQQLEQDIAGHVKMLNNSEATIRRNSGGLPPTAQLPATTDDLAQYVHWTMAVNLILDNLERQKRVRFTDRDSEAMLAIKGWLDRQHIAQAK